MSAFPSSNRMICSFHKGATNRDLYRFEPQITAGVQAVSFLGEQVKVLESLTSDR